MLQRLKGPLFTPSACLSTRISTSTCKQSSWQCSYTAYAVSSVPLARPNRNYHSKTPEFPNVNLLGSPLLSVRLRRRRRRRRPSVTSAARQVMRNSAIIRCVCGRERLMPKSLIHYIAPRYFEYK